MECLYLKAPNDKNGNPRRLFVIIQEGRTLEVFDEGYFGINAVPKMYQKLLWFRYEIPVSASFYNQMKKEVKE